MTYKCLQCGTVVNNTEVYGNICPCCTNNLWAALFHIYYNPKISIDEIMVKMNIHKGKSPEIVDYHSDRLCCCGDYESRHTLSTGHSFVDAERYHIDCLEEENKKLHKENAELKKEFENLKEIIYPRICDKNHTHNLNLLVSSNCPYCSLDNLKKDHKALSRDYDRLVRSNETLKRFAETFLDLADTLKGNI